MQDEWEFYPTRVDDMPASIYVNMTYRDRSPMRDAGILAWLSIRFQVHRADGLSSQDEYATLCAIEDALVDLLDQSPALNHYVGRNTSQGCRDYYIYTDSGLLVEQILSQAMIQFPDYEFQTGHREEPDWSTYRDFLLPSPRDMQLIKNQRVIETLQEANDRLDEPRNVLHWAYFRDSTSCDLFINRATQLGFELDHRVEPNSDSEQWGAVLSRLHPVNYWSIAEVTLALYDLAAEFGGNYDGWETPIV